MKSRRILASIATVMLIAAACSSSSDSASAPSGTTTTAASSAGSATVSTTTEPATTAPTTTAPTTTAPIPDGGSAIGGVHVDEIVFGTGGHVRIANTGDSDISLDGLWLCQFPVYFPLSGTLAAGDVLEISASELGGLNPAGGEAAIYTSRDFGSAESIIDYVGWGTGGARGEVASLAGIWPQGATVSAPDDLIELGGAAGDPESWG